MDQLDLMDLDDHDHPGDTKFNDEDQQHHADENNMVNKCSWCYEPLDRVIRGLFPQYDQEDQQGLSHPADKTQ